jgi:hypothetical protein
VSVKWDSPPNAAGEASGRLRLRGTLEDHNAILEGVWKRKRRSDKRDLEEDEKRSYLDSLCVYDSGERPGSQAKIFCSPGMSISLIINPVNAKETSQPLDINTYSRIGVFRECLGLRHTDNLESYEVIDLL